MLSACQSGPEVEHNQVIDQTAIARIDSTLHSVISDSLVVGAFALIVEKGDEVYFNAVGYAERENGVPNARNTIATIHSKTKPIRQRIREVEKRHLGRRHDSHCRM